MEAKRYMDLAVTKLIKYEGEKVAKSLINQLLKQSSEYAITELMCYRHPRNMVFYLGWNSSKEGSVYWAKIHNRLGNK